MAQPKMNYIENEADNNELNMDEIESILRDSENR